MNDIVTAPELYTERLRLSDMTDKDALSIVEWRSNPDVYRFFVSPHELTLEEHLNWFRNRYVYDTNRFDWVAFDKDEEAIGVFGAKRNDEISGKVEISYILSPKYYGKGYASEAVERVILFCKENWNCRKVIAEIHRDNVDSIKFITRLGFSKESCDGNFIIYSRTL